MIFIRSQLDYINSRYGYSLKRFYHHDTFATYVEKILNNKSPLKQGSRSHADKRSDIFDFWNYFSALLDEHEQGLDVRFIPFRQTHPDPFVQFLDTIGLDVLRGPSPGRQSQPTHRSTGDLAGQVFSLESFPGRFRTPPASFPRSASRRG